MTQTKKPAKLKQPAKRTPKIAAKQKIRRARPLHKRLALHPVTIFTLLCVGVFISCWSYKTLADSYDVTGKVPAPALTTGALITSPTEGDNFTDPAVTVSGTCPADSYVKLTINGTFSGSVFCAADGTFQIQADLYVGQNALVAQDYNVTDDAGPATAAVNVTYTPRPPTPSGGSPEGSSQPPSSSSIGLSQPPAQNPPLLLISDYHYQTYVVGGQYVGSLDIEGGTAPFAANISWGDGTSGNLIFKTNGVFAIKHTYEKPGYYVIIVTIVDHWGVTRFLQLAARIVATDKTGTVAATTPASGQGAQPGSIAKILGDTKIWLLIAWPSFILVSMMTFSFWLGERQELSELVTHGRLRHASRGHTKHRRQHA